MLRIAAVLPSLSLFLATIPAQEFLPDGGFETGAVTACAQGELPPPWLQASTTLPGADVWTTDCVVSGGLQISHWSHFPSTFVPHGGQRFAAGWSSANEAMATPLAGNLVPGQVYRLSGWFVTSHVHLGRSGYDVYLSSTPMRTTGYYVGSIGTSATHSVWTAHHLDFRAPPGVSYLVLDPRTDDSNYIGVDDLSLQLSPAGGRFVSWGNGVRGTNGMPVLAGTGNVAPGQTITLTMTGGLGNALGVQVIGFTPGFVPVPGGVLVPNPDIVLVTVTSPQGSMSLSAVWPSTPFLSGVFFQFGVFDTGAVQGVSMSNALQAVQ